MSFVASVYNIKPYSITSGFGGGGVPEVASQGMYMSKIEICFFTARILQNQRMLCCGECFHD
jgi:hypothetical protein